MSKIWIFFLLFIGLQQNIPAFSADFSTDKAPNQVDKSEEEDFSRTPFTQYGEFNAFNDDEEDAKYYQFGRFFGVSLGLGFEFIDGNRGILWQGGFPMIDLKVHYWFDFNFGLDLGFFSVYQYFNTSAQGLQHVDINMLRVGIDIKYYISTRDLSAALSFANPFFLLGAGSFTKTQNSNVRQTQDQDSSLGVSLGMGLEMVVSPKKVYFQIEAKMHLVTFQDTYTTDFQSASIQDLTGNFYTLSGNMLFTW